MKKLTFFLFTTLFAAVPAATHAQIKYLAVVETELDQQSGAFGELNRAEVRQITAELRNVAVKNLPSGKYNIMTQETVMAQGSAVLEDCSEENCVIALGNKIGADYIVRGIVSKFGTYLTLSVEIYETADGNLVGSSGLVRSENVIELLDKAAAVCAEMYMIFAASQGSARNRPVAQAAYTVTVIVSPPHGGTVSRNPDRTTYAPGALINLQAAPAAGYTFAGGRATPLAMRASWRLWRTGTRR